MSLHPKHLGGLMFTLAFLSLLAAMNAVLFNVAFPLISHDLAVNTSQVSWLAVAYSLVVAIGSIIYGKLADYLPVRRLFLIGIGLFVSGSMVGFLWHQNLFIIILARMLQASGGSAFITLAMIAVRIMLPLNQHPLAFAAISIGIGPLAGGFIVRWLPWPYLFLSMLISLGGAGLLLAFMPSQKITTNIISFDYLGASLLFFFITGLLLGVNRNLWFLLLAVGVLLVLGTHLRWRTNPFIDIALLADRSFVRVIANGLIINIILLGVLLLLPLLLADVYQLSTVTTGAIFFLAALFSSTASMLSGRLLVCYNQVSLIYGGAGLMILGLIILSIFASHSLLLTILGTVLIFISYSTIQVALNSLVPLTLNSDRIGVGLGLYNLTNFIGMALGPALASKLLELGANYSFLFLGAVLVVLPLFPLLYKLVLPTRNSLLQDRFVVKTKQR